MNKEELTPIEELVVNYANNVLNKNIRLEDIDDIAFDWDSAKFSYKPGENGYIKTMEIELKDLGVKYDEIEKYEKEVYTSAINHVVRLIRNDLITSISRICILAKNILYHLNFSHYLQKKLKKSMPIF